MHYSFTYCVLIPTYNNAQTLAAVVNDAKNYTNSVIVVNDGSTDQTSEILKSLNNITVVEYLRNKGKGFALQTGMAKAREMGFNYAVTIDSDGQHFANDIPLLLKAIEQNPNALIIGSRNLQQKNMPGKNTFANKFSNFWFKIETGISLSDTQSGFRAYPLNGIKTMRFFSGKYEFELEVLVRAAWRGIPLVQVPINVYYAPEGLRVSHFKPLRDFTRISILNTVLVTIAFLWVIPFKFLKSLNSRSIRQFVNDNITNTGQSNSVIALSVSLGIFMGIVPVWGWQMILAFSLAHVLKLNKTITLVASNISIPPIIPFILLGSFATGAFILGNQLHFAVSDISFETVKQNIIQYLLGSVVFAAICAFVTGGTTFLLLKFFRKTGVIHLDTKD